jgi:hypothetical protein
MKHPGPFGGKKTFTPNGPGRHVHAALGQMGRLAAIRSWLRICSRKRPPRERARGCLARAPASLLAFAGWQPGDSTLPHLRPPRATCSGVGRISQRAEDTRRSICPGHCPGAKFAGVPQGPPLLERLSGPVHANQRGGADSANPMLFSLIRTTEIPARSGSQSGSQQPQSGIDPGGDEAGTADGTARLRGLSRGMDANSDFDVRLQDVPLTNRRPDVVVYRADTIDITPTRPEHVLLAVEIVSPGSETTDPDREAEPVRERRHPFFTGEWN